MTDAKKLAGQLTKWCNTELGLKTTSSYQSGPVPHEFTQLCLGNNMKKVWKHIMENVRNTTTVEKVKSTLQLHTLQEELVHTKTQLDTSNEEYDDVSKEIMLLEEKIKLKQSEISKSQIVNLSLRNDIQENNSKTFVQSSSSEQFLMKAKQLETETQMLKATVAENVDKKTKCGVNSVGPCYTACLKDLILLQGMVEDLVRNQTKQETDGNQPFVLWKAARHLVAKYPARIICDALKSLATEHKEKVMLLESSINMKRDIEDIAESISLDGEGKSTLTLETSLKKYEVECAADYGRAATLEENAKRAMEEIDGMVMKLQSSDDKMNLTLQAEIAALKSQEFLKLIKSAMNNSQREVEAKRTTHEQHQLRRNEIKNFGKELEKHGRQITHFSKENLKLRETLPQLPHEAQEHSGRLHSEIQPALHKMAQCLYNAHEDELKLFKTATFEPMCAVKESHTGNKEMMPVSDLTINYPLTHPCITGGTTYHDISQLFNGCSIKACSSLIEEIIHVTDLVNDNKFNHLACAECEKVSADKLQEIQKLKAKLQSFQEQERSKYVPLINNGMGCAEQVKSEVDKLSKAADIWFEEPGQHQVPWLPHNGSTMDQ